MAEQVRMATAAEKEDATEREARRTLEAAWSEYEAAVAALKKAHNERMEQALKRLSDEKVMAWRVFADGQAKAWARFRERTGQSTAP